jgi:hypothetical protein
MNRTILGSPLATEKKKTGLIELAVYSICLLGLSFATVEAGMYAMSAILGV